MQTTEDFAPTIARFNDLVPYQSQHANNGIPRQVMEYLAANKVFPVVSPHGLVGRNALAPLRGWPGLCISIAQCTPKQGPVSHNHTGTLENFYCLDGQFDILWGNHLENKVTLEPGDLCSMPPGIYRAFKNLTDSEARLLVLIQGDEKMSDQIQMPRLIGENVRNIHGDNVMELLAKINMRFEGDDLETPPKESIHCRVARSKHLMSKTSHDFIFPIMSPTLGVAPIVNWPGLNLSLLAVDGGKASTDMIDTDQCEWIFNLTNVPCQVDLSGMTTTLHQYDLILIEPGLTRIISNKDGFDLKVLLARQTKETIQNQALI